MKNPITRPKFTAITIMVGLLVLLPALFGSGANASLQDQIDALNKQISESQSTLNGLSAQKDTLQNKLAGIDAEIAQLQAQIDKTNLEIQQTQGQLEEAERNLAKQKRIMYENAKTLYKEGNASTIEILASSSNFSEFVNRQQYLEKVRESVNKAAKAIAALKVQLETKKGELNTLSLQQQAQKSVLDSKRSEQQTLLDQTAGEESRYQQQVSSLNQQRADAERKLLAQIRAGTLKGGSGAGTAVQPGQHVSRGQVIGFVGNSGYAEGPHLHFVLIDGGSFTDPVADYSGPTLKYGMQWPVEGAPVSQRFGCQSEIVYAQSCGSGSWLHAGVDIAGSYGAPIVAAESGTVTYAGCNGGSGYGNMVILSHASGRQTYYPHMGSGCR